jgi:lactam utilization protein B
VKKSCIDLNSDMGEGFGPWTIGDGVDAEIMPLISSANIATGFHAGDPNIMARTVQSAKEAGVGVGAHPGFRDLVGFGRRMITESPQALVNDIVFQLGALREFARLADVSVQHVKPHGALYMLAARDEELSRCLIATLQKIDPTLLLYCMESSVTYKVARELGQPVVREFYADRDYDASGSACGPRVLRRSRLRREWINRFHPPRRPARRRPSGRKSSARLPARTGFNSRGRRDRHRFRFGLHPQRHPGRTRTGPGNTRRADRQRHPHCCAASGFPQ